MEGLFANDGRYFVYRSTAVPPQAIYFIFFFIRGPLVRTNHATGYFCPGGGESIIVHTDGSFRANALDHDSDRIYEAHGIVGRITCAYTAHEPCPCNPWVGKEELPFMSARCCQLSARTYPGAETSRPP